ncbi:MAG TPA: molecular chaperone [Novosphingobium sp.]|nr:molecular chaperone [Novosphingobium sp.]HMP55600.1 molecular chaperone [Novosphingobium sp.]
MLARRLLAPSLALSALAVPVVPALAQGDLLVAPTRLVMNGAGNAEVVLNNIGAQPATYRISVELRRMTEDGSIEAVDEDQVGPDQRAIMDMFRYSPRRILLAPNQPQSVRISARPPEGLADGEYRVHLSFRAIPETRPAEEAPADEPQSGFSIRLTPIYGVSIPLILRKGQLQATTTLHRPAVVREGNATALTLDIERQGNRSVYGEIRVMAPGRKDPVYMVRGIAVYPEITRRSLSLPLSPDQAAAMKGPMQVEFREMPENGGRLIASVSASF